jgi:hypothetical protein
VVGVGGGSHQKSRQSNSSQLLNLKSLPLNNPNIVIKNFNDSSQLMTDPYRATSRSGGGGGGQEDKKVDAKKFVMMAGHVSGGSVGSVRPAIVTL